ncbi:MAG: riboflavin biosynthesis protein RibF [Bacteroidales bacterium]|nr:riboflavin biosynthesis protein RibF [Bacteroidales bacterium]
MAVVTTGFFDGVHLGHRHVIETLVSCARERGQEAIVVTFWPHPRTVLQQDARDFRILTTLEEKKRMLAAMGVDRVEVIPFTREFASLTAREYLKLLKDKYHASVIVMGYDNRLGSDQKTFRELAGSSLKKVVFADGEVEMVGSSLKKAIFADDAAVSSTVIRKALLAGDVAAANAMLGYEYELTGAVVSGNRLGRTIGFPTANLQLYEPLKLVPGNGVYCVEVEVLGVKYRGMCNIGNRPTVGGVTRTIETHILDFDQDIYGLPLTLRFERRIRDERKFASLEELRKQLEQDRDECRARACNE